MRYTMTYDQWDIVLIPFPFTNLTITKKRPALIISPSAFNREFEAAIIMFITSNVSAYGTIGDYKIKQWKKAGLPKPSMSRMKLATVDKNIIIKKFGRLKEVDVTAIQKKLKNFFGEDEGNR